MAWKRQHFHEHIGKNDFKEYTLKNRFIIDSKPKNKSRKSTNSDNENKTTIR